MVTRTATSDIIAAVATPAGRGGLGVVRVSGPNLERLVQALLGKVPEPRRATHTRFCDADGHPIDDGVALYFKSPASFTGEDVLELQGHGGPVVMHMLLRRCLELGARVAEPGEFTRRAYLNDKLDLAQAEAVADLIDAASEKAARAAVRSLQGEFSEAVHALERDLIELRMLVEATLDFPEEEIDAVDRVHARERVQQLRENLEKLLARARQGARLRSGLHVVLAGQPNVGKSSLLNRLAGEERAIVTPIPGTTRDALRESIEIDGVPLSVVDTAGLRETSDEIEKIGIERTWREIEQADALLLVVDARKGVTAEDEAILGRMPVRLKRIVVHNKIDIAELEPGTKKTDEGVTVFLSAKRGDGIEDLRRALLAVAGLDAQEEDVFIARERHVAALRRAGEHLAEALEPKHHVELTAEELRLAHNALGTITGEFSADDLLGEIFSRFCIGK